VDSKHGTYYEAQALNSNSMGMYMASSKTFEINPINSIIEEIRKRSEIDSNDATVKDLIILLFDTALISSGFSLENPSSFAERINRMVSLGLGLEEKRDFDSGCSDISDSNAAMEEVD